jgi:folylpolyglutamate synthase/dihydropteroate synthase
MSQANVEQAIMFVAAHNLSSMTQEVARHLAATDKPEREDGSFMAMIHYHRLSGLVELLENPVSDISPQTAAALRELSQRADELLNALVGDAVAPDFPDTPPENP